MYILKDNMATFDLCTVSFTVCELSIEFFYITLTLSLLQVLFDSVAK